METVNSQDSIIYDNDAVPSAARQTAVDQEATLSTEQRAALMKVLQDTKPAIYVKKEETQRSGQQEQQQKFVQEQQELQQKYLNTQKKQKKRTIRKTLISILLITGLSFAGFFGWYYWWTTHATFEHKLQPMVILEGQHISPYDFIVPGDNTDRISAVFRNPLFKPSAGHQEVQLTLTMGWRTVEASAPLYIMTAVNRLKYEYAAKGPEFKPADFVANASVAAGVHYDLRFVEEPMLPEDYPVGEYKLYLSLNGAPFEVHLTVEDTTPPSVTPVNLVIIVGDKVEPEDFVTGISDASDDLPIKISYYEAKPNVFGNDQIITIKVMDHYGNYTVARAGLTIQYNKEPPVIEGTDTILINAGDTILFMQGVTAYDDFGRDLTDRIRVDRSGVNQDEAGIYTVRYMVTDLTGLSFETEETVQVINSEVDLDLVNEEIDKAIAGIINDDMTQLEQVRAIFNWVRSNISYAINRDRPETAYEGAYMAIRDRRGNCYVFYSLSELMLTRAGIPNMLIERIPGTPTAHRWNLVNPDGLGWHHYDSFPARVGTGDQLAYFTDTQAKDFTRRLANHAERPAYNYYTYDPTLYPEIVE